ncbi:hypothetical protein F8M41_004767 [Gigaspora margarita]|uniref:Uncharacterized protein n=1 Tax=Gigaspora margarita TaxID=4874 RepID=A0A8H3X981_GIGMA|nr:hypothetical protein F8M41_004767 [Gigaspora margarita]
MVNNAIAVLENSNKYEKYIQYLRMILSKSQSIQTRQIQQLSKDNVQGLQDAKNSIENYITESLQSSIKILEDEIVVLNGYNQNGIKTKDDLIYQQEVRYLNSLNAENEKLKNYLIKKRDQYVKLNIKIFIDDNLIQNQNINFNDSEFDTNEMIEKLEKFIMNQYINFEILSRKEAFNAFNSSSDGWQLINDIQIFRKEKVRLENHLKEKFKEQIELNQSTLKESMENSMMKQIKSKMN